LVQTLRLQVDLKLLLGAGYRRFLFWPVVADLVDSDAALLLFMFPLRC
jgi:hypothetical protein